MSYFSFSHYLTFQFLTLSITSTIIIQKIPDATSILIDWLVEVKLFLQFSYISRSSSFFLKVSV
jgi:hypothetical protein